MKTRFLRSDNRGMVFLSKVADIVILNLLFVLFSIPVITLGASWTSLYHTTVKIIRYETGYTAKEFWKSFKENFFMTTIIWMILLGVYVLSFGGMYVLAIKYSGTAQVVIIALYVIIVLFTTIIFTYIFPAAARYEMNIPTAFYLSVRMAVAHPVRTLLMILQDAVFVLIMSYAFTVHPVILFAVPSVHILIKSYICEPVLRECMQYVEGDTEESMYNNDLPPEYYDEPEESVSTPAEEDYRKFAEIAAGSGEETEKNETGREEDGEKTV